MRILSALTCVAAAVAALAGPVLAAAPHFAGVAVTPVFCFALNASIADAIRQKAGSDTAESMAFSRRANRIELAVLAPHGDDVEARATEEMKLREALENFDVKAFDTLPEVEAEAIMTHCLTLAGPDE